MRKMPKPTLVRIAIGGLCLVLSATILWETAQWSRSLALDAIRDRSEHTLSLVVENLRGELARYRYLPGLLAAASGNIDVLRGTAPAEKIDAFNRELERVTNLSGALDTYVMDRSGLTVAASNYAADRTFLGKNFHYRPYYKQAMTGRLGRYFALGTTSGERGYYFAHPVRDGTDIAGVLVVKVKVDHLESAWRSTDHEILVTDDDGVVFLSSNPAWRFQTLEPLDEAVRQRVQTSLRYPDAALEPLPISRRTALDDGGFLMTVATNSAGTGDHAAESVFLVQQRTMVDAGWNVLILANTNEVGGRVVTAVAVVGFMLVSLLLGAVTMYQRQRRIRDRIDLQQQLNAELEERVRARTDELTRANVRLKEEVSVRHKAEDELRRTQADFVQVTKLAALGQMSAGLSHELNQPLAAIRSYADNARAFLDRDDSGKAHENLSSISGLTERMARIIRHLRTYARKEPLDIRPTSVGDAIGGALMLLDQRIQSAGITVHKSLPRDEVQIQGGDARLQQILVNLFSNALDAMETAPVKSLDIAVRADDGNVVITVRDTGPGIPEQDLANVFDPFFTSKEVGKGLGLGLSITYGIVRQFGGSIKAANYDQGGAIFTVTLVPVTVAKGRAA